MTAHVAIFVVCLFHDRLLTPQPCHALCILSGFTTRFVNVTNNTAENLTFDGDVNLKKRMFRGIFWWHFWLLFNSDTMEILWSNLFSPFTNLLKKGVFKCTDYQPQPPCSFDSMTLFLDITMGEAVLFQESAGVIRVRQPVVKQKTRNTARNEVGEDRICYWVIVILVPVGGFRYRRLFICSLRVKRKTSHTTDIRVYNKKGHKKGELIRKEQWTKISNIWMERSKSWYRTQCLEESWSVSV
jgi:hypothetical protein